MKFFSVPLNISRYLEILLGGIVSCSDWSSLKRLLRIVNNKSKDWISKFMSLCNLFIYSE